MNYRTRMRDTSFQPKYGSLRAQTKVSSFTVGRKKKKMIMKLSREEVDRTSALLYWLNVMRTSSTASQSEITLYFWVQKLFASIPLFLYYYLFCSHLTASLEFSDNRYFFMMSEDLSIICSGCECITWVWAAQYLTDGCYALTPTFNPLKIMISAEESLDKANEVRKWSKISSQLISQILDECTYHILSLYICPWCHMRDIGDLHTWLSGV